CEDLQTLCRELEAGAGTVVLPEGALDEREAAELVAAPERQPAWSDLPLLMLTRAGPDSPQAARPLGPLGNAMFPELPVRLSSPDRPAWQRAKEVMERQIRHQTRLVDDLLDVSRITQGKIQLRPERVDLALLLRETLGDHRAGMEEHGLTLEIELRDAPVWVR